MSALNTFVRLTLVLGTLLYLLRDQGVADLASLFLNCGISISHQSPPHDPKGWWGCQRKMRGVLKRERFLDFKPIAASAPRRSLTSKAQTRGISAWGTNDDIFSMLYPHLLQCSPRQAMVHTLPPCLWCSAILSKMNRKQRGMTPCNAGSFRTPVMVKVLPLPLWPYAKMVAVGVYGPKMMHRLPATRPFS